MKQPYPMTESYFTFFRSSVYGKAPFGAWISPLLNHTSFLVLLCKIYRIICNQTIKGRYMSDKKTLSQYTDYLSFINHLITELGPFRWLRATASTISSAAVPCLFLSYRKTSVTVVKKILQGHYGIYRASNRPCSSTASYSSAKAAEPFTHWVQCSCTGHDFIP